MKTIEILLVEDNPGDVRLTRELLREARILNQVTVAGDGEQAMSMLHGRHGAAPFRPDLILLDLNLPKKGGHEVLGEIKQDPELRMIPIVILTTSDAEKDIVRSYGQHANCYVVKPVDLGRFVDIVRSIENFWLTAVKLPPRDAA